MADSERGPEADDGGEIEAPPSEISDLIKMAAPHSFEADLTETIRRRSGGRFFARKTLADRVPFLLLAIIALLVGLAIFAVVRASDTGSLRYQKSPTKQPAAPGARDQMPSPYPRK